MPSLVDNEHLPGVTFTSIEGADVCAYACVYWLGVCDEQLQQEVGVDDVNAGNNRYVEGLPNVPRHYKSHLPFDRMT